MRYAASIAVFSLLLSLLSCTAIPQARRTLPMEQPYIGLDGPKPIVVYISANDRAVRALCLTRHLPVCDKVVLYPHYIGYLVIDAEYNLLWKQKSSDFSYEIWARDLGKGRDGHGTLRPCVGFHFPPWRDGTYTEYTRKGDPHYVERLLNRIGAWVDSVITYGVAPDDDFIPEYYNTYAEREGHIEGKWSSYSHTLDEPAWYEAEPVPVLYPGLFCWHTGYRRPDFKPWTMEHTVPPPPSVPPFDEDGMNTCSRIIVY